MLPASALPAARCPQGPCLLPALPVHQPAHRACCLACLARAAVPQIQVAAKEKNPKGDIISEARRCCREGRCARL